MGVQLSEVLAITRTYLNDDNATQFTDAALIPKVQEAHRELQEELWKVGSPVVRAQSAPITIPANALELSADSTPELPSDFLCPFAVYEKFAGTYLQMTEVFDIPLNYTKGAKLIYWAWQQERIKFAGATVNVDVVVRYRRKITIPSALGNEIGMLFSESYLGARAAAIAAGTLGNKEVYEALTALAKENLGKVLIANRGQQTPILRP